MVRRPVSLHPRAEAEARAVRRWYRERDQIAAERFVADLDAAILKVSGNPARWPVYLHGTRRVLLRRFPYSVIYQVLPEVVYVLAVAHQQRRPGYWRARR
jgi:toxin ParE1/3/4